MSLDFAPMVDLVETLNGLDEVRATLDPAEVNTPGVWVTLEQIRAVNIRHDSRIQAVLYLIAQDQDYQRALLALQTLYNAIVPTVLTPDGPVVPQGVLLPQDPSNPLPALRVPVNLY